VVRGVGVGRGVGVPPGRGGVGQRVSASGAVEVEVSAKDADDGATARPQVRRQNQPIPVQANPAASPELKTGASGPPGGSAVTPTGMAKKAANRPVQGSTKPHNPSLIVNTTGNVQRRETGFSQVDRGLRQIE